MHDLRHGNFVGAAVHHSRANRLCSNAQQLHHLQHHHHHHHRGIGVGEAMAITAGAAVVAGAVASAVRQQPHYGHPAMARSNYVVLPVAEPHVVAYSQPRQQVLIEGWLTKQAVSASAMWKNWKRRWITVEPDLVLWRSARFDPARGTMPINARTQITRTTARPHCLSVVSQGRELLLEAQNANELQLWWNAISGAISSHHQHTAAQAPIAQATTAHAQPVAHSQPIAQAQPIAQMQPGQTHSEHLQDIPIAVGSTVPNCSPTACRPTQYYPSI